MKLSFSTKGWHGRSFDDLCDMAEATGFSGIELHNINGPLFTDRDGAFHGHAAAATKRKLYDRKLSIPCLDVLSDPAATTFEAAKDEILSCLAIAGDLGIRMLRVRTDSQNADEAREKTARLIGAVLPEAEAQGVTILLETSGVFAKTEMLRDILEQFASDRLAALWEVAEAYLVGGDDPETVVRNLGAYIRHVHFSDVSRDGNGCTHVLMGEGEIPFRDVMRALRSVNYDGFLSLVWDPAWCPELDDMEIVLAQFEGYMKQFSDPRQNERTLYWNRAHKKAPFTVLLDWWCTVVRGTGVKLYVGHALYQCGKPGWGPDELVSQLRLVRSRPEAAGSVLFSSHYLVSPPDPAVRRAVSGVWTQGE